MLVLWWGFEKINHEEYPKLPENHQLIFCENIRFFK